MQQRPQPSRRPRTPAPRGRARRALVAAAGALALAAAALLPGDASAVGQDGLPRTLPQAQAGATPDVPPILSEADVTRYRRIFELGEAGKWDAVDRLIARLDNDILVGHALAQRYLHPSQYWTPFKEARAWMAAYHDHPYAPRLYRLAQQRKRDHGGSVHRATYDRADGAMRVKTRPHRVGSIETLSTRASTGAARGVLRQVRYNVRRTRLTITEAYLNEPETAAKLTQSEQDRGFAMVAAGWYYHGNDTKALKLAAPAAARSGAAVPMAHWIAGLAAWRGGDIARAAPHFEALAGMSRLSDGARAAGAFWAARAKLRLRQPAAVSDWLRKAAARPQTFYGLLAAEALGVRWPLGFDAAAAGADSLERLTALPAGRRALALMQVGERARARRELLGIDGWDDPEMLRVLLLAAERGGMPALAYRLGSRLAGRVGEDMPGPAVNAAMYPIPPWRPATGFKVDRALVYALMRRESRFQPRARSGAGARGLMQLMPSTASYMARRENFAYSRRALYQPDVNLDLAQRYLRYLLDGSIVDGDLVRLTIAYNAGPGNLRAWLRDMAHTEDPLLFIESLPSRETRHFVERILTNLWIYRERLDQPAPSRAALASGQWPSYVRQEEAGPQEVATR